MNAIHAVFEEESATSSVTSLPMSHLSIEVGHLYLEDIVAGPHRLTELAQQVAPWAHTARDMCAQVVAPKTPRVSTCFLIDDYFSPVGSPRDVIPMILEAARRAEVAIDYVVRESACANVESLSVASLVLGHVVADPPPDSDGTRPAPQDSGWLCNGVRSPVVTAAEAMAPRVGWRPPAENGANPHSVFLDVQLWDEGPRGRRWACAFLAAVWQLLRLGTLRSMGEPVVSIVDWDGSLPDTWDELPPIIRLRPTAAPFAAYRTFSVLPNRFVPVEHAVRIILSQVAISDAVARQIHERAAKEHLFLPPEVVDRIGYTFIGGRWR